jgi:hypothetical protein
MILSSSLNSDQNPGEKKRTKTYFIYGTANLNRSSISYNLFHRYIRTLSLLSGNIRKDPLPVSAKQRRITFYMHADCTTACCHISSRIFLLQNPAGARSAYASVGPSGHIKELIRQTGPGLPGPAPDFSKL